MRLWLCSLISFALLCTGTVSAAPTDAEKKQARALMDEGDALAAKKEYSRALEKYLAGDAIMRVPTTGLEVARTLERLGRLLEAKERAQAVASSTRTGDEPEVFEKARSSARELAEKLDARIPTLELEVKGARPGAAIEVRIDGKRMESEPPLKKQLDPGQHELSVSAPQHTTSVKSLTFAEGAMQKVEIEIRPTDAASVPPPKSPPPDPPADTKTSPLVYAGFGVAAAGVVVGSVAGVVSLQKTSKAKEDCDGDDCPQSSKDEIDSAKTFATISNVGFAFAIVGGAVGVYGLLSSSNARGDAKRHPVRAKSRAPSLDAAVGPRFIGVFGTF